MDNVNKTLYIPLYGRSYVSRLGILISDPRAEEIWEKAGFPLSRRARSRHLAYYLGMRAAVFDRYLTERLAEHPEALVLHLGCGLDSRFERVGASVGLWLDIDLPAVIAERRRHYGETDGYRMLGADLDDPSFVRELPSAPYAVVLLEGVSMYLEPAATAALFEALAEHYPALSLLVDCYTPWAARLSRIKNPIRSVGVSRVFGIGDPKELAVGGLAYVWKHEITPQELVSELPERDRRIFRRLYAGRLAARLYRLYEYRGPFSPQEEDANILKLAGMATLPAGKYEKIESNGALTIAGDIECRNLCSGGRVCGASVASEYAVWIRGNACFTGEGRGREITVSGRGSFGAVRVGDTFSFLGRAAIETRLRARGNVKGIGRLTVGEDIETPFFFMSATMRTGALRADTVHIYFKRGSKATSISGSDEVKIMPCFVGKSRIGFKWYHSLKNSFRDFLRLFRGTFRVADTIKGGDVYLSQVTCPRVKGCDVEIGPFCRIGHVKYSGRIKISRLARVGHVERI